MSEAARAAANAADASMLRDRVTSAFGAQYLIGPEIGRGGMAVVYSAEDIRLQRQVALKVLPPDLAFRSDVRERFVREAQTAARLNHPHIVPIYAVHEEAGMVCFAMGLVTGESVAARLQHDPRPSVEFVATVLEQTADALAYAHACGVVHRDVKPDNILLDRDSGRAMVTDFGIARAAESGSRLTQTGIAVGTPAFMSPEQATGEKEVDGRSDLYSLGVVGYLMLAGRLPFEANTTPAMLVKHVSETPPAILTLRPNAPASLADILERCLAKRPSDRWDNALAMRDALRRVQRDGSLAKLGGAVAPSYQPRPYRAGTDHIAAEYAERAGHRSEDWAPRGLQAPNAADRQLPASSVPPMPNFPPLSPLASQDEQREWKNARRDALKDWRHAVKDQRKMTREQWREELEYGAAGGMALERSDDALIGRFKGQLATTAGMILFLATINAVTSPAFPWAIFPAMGMGLGIIGRYAKLRARGITWGQIWSGEKRATREADSDIPKPKRIERAVGAFKKHLKWLGVSVASSVAVFAVGAGFSIEPLIPVWIATLIASAVSSQLTLVDYFRLRRLGISVGDARGDGWKAIAARSDDRPRDLKMRDTMERIAGTSTLSSSYGETVRNAVDDHLTITETASRLSDADKAMVPDVAPTADALLERIGALASGLERLERDIPGDVIGQLDARIASISAEAENAPDRERRLSLLTRQRASLEELTDKRGTMQRQLESASLALRSLRFDMVKLRTLGVGAAIGDVTNATQEARALSLDIGRALYAADEVRKL